MGVEKPQSACRNKFPAHSRPPARPPKDTRCTEPRLHSPSKGAHRPCVKSCVQTQEIAPTPNPYGPLAGLPQAPTLPDWALDPPSTTSDRLARRGVRGRTRQKTKRAAQKRRDEHRSESTDELCRRLAALRLDDDASVQQPRRSKGDCSIITIAEPGPVFSPDSVRHHWAPHFRPNRTPVPQSETIETMPETVPTQPFQVTEQKLPFNTTGLKLDANTVLEPGPKSLVTTEPTARYEHGPKLPNVEYKKDQTDSDSSLVFSPTTVRRATLQPAEQPAVLDKFDFSLPPLANPLPA